MSKRAKIIAGTIVGLWIALVIFIFVSIVTSDTFSLQAPAEKKEAQKVEQCLATEFAKIWVAEAEARAKTRKEVTRASFRIKEAKCKNNTAVALVIVSKLNYWAPKETSIFPEGTHVCSILRLEAFCEIIKDEFKCSSGNMSVLELRPCPAP